MKLIISAIVVGTLSATNVLGLDREAFNECYAVHKAESIWPSYSFHQCILKQDHSNYTITQNAVIKNCQRIRNSSLLFAEVSNKYYKLLDSISLEITKVNEFLISLHNYDERTPEDPLKFDANSSFTRELRKKIDLLSYYALIYYKNHKHVYGYRNEVLERVKMIEELRGLILRNIASYNHNTQIPTPEIAQLTEDERSSLINALITYVSDYLDMINGFLNTLLQAKKVMLTDRTVQIADDSEEGRVDSIYSCIVNTLQNTSSLKPDNEYITLNSPLTRHLFDMLSIQNSEHSKMELAKIRNDMAEYNTRKEAYVNITAYIDKKLSKVRLFANSDYFDVVDIDVSGGTPKLYLSNNNVYHSRYEWAMDYSTDESTSITNELIGLLNMEFEFLTDHGIIAEIKASLAE